MHLGSFFALFARKVNSFETLRRRLVVVVGWMVQLKMICEFVVPGNIFSLHFLLACFQTPRTQPFLFILWRITPHVEFSFRAKQFLRTIRTDGVCWLVLLGLVCDSSGTWTSAGCGWQWTTNVGAFCTSHSSSSFVHYLC